MALDGVEDAMMQQVLAFPPHPPPAQPSSDAAYHAGIRHVVETLASCPASKLTAAISGKNKILDIVDPSVNTIPYLYALLATARMQPDGDAIIPNTPLYAKTAAFLSSFDTVQARYGGHQLRELFHLVLRGAGTDRQNTVATVELICMAMLRLDPDGSTLTSTHLNIVDVSLRNRAYSSPLTLLDKDIFHLPSPIGLETPLPQYPCSQHATSAGFITEQSGLTDRLAYQGYLKYFLYGASIYIANKLWRRALHFLEIVLTAVVSGQSFSMIQAEAYKKWCLVHLLVYGKAGPPPRNMIQPVAKHCQSVAKAYIGLADKFKDSDPRKMRDEIAVGPFKDDCNYGLVLFVLAAHRRHKVSKLSDTYSSLTVTQVSELTSVAPSDADAAQYIENLIAEKQLDALLTKPPDHEGPGDLVLTFDAPLQQSRKPLELVQEQLVAAAKLATVKNHMAATQRRVELSKDYLAAAKKIRRAEDGKAAGGHGVGEDDDVFGEDL